MVTTKLTKSKFMLYDCAESMSSLAWFLSEVSEDDFLALELGLDEGDSFLEWLKKDDPTKTRKETDTILALKKDNRIFIGHCYNSDGSFDLKNREENFDWANAFETSRENIIHIIEEWYYLLNMNPHPDEIIMVEKGEKVTFESKFYAESKLEDQSLPKVGLGVK